MAENLRAEYVTKVSAENATGLRKIRALQRLFQVRDLEGRVTMTHYSLLPANTTVQRRNALSADETGP